MAGLGAGVEKLTEVRYNGVCLRILAQEVPRIMEGAILRAKGMCNFVIGRDHFFLFFFDAEPSGLS